MAPQSNQKSIVQKNKSGQEKPAGGNLPFPLRLVDLWCGITPAVPEDCVGVLASGSPSQCIAKSQETGVWSAVQFAQEKFEERLWLAAELVQNPSAFFTHTATQILTPLKSSNTKRLVERRWRLKASTQKKYLLHLVAQYLRQFSDAKPAAESVAMIADELITNVFFNAPFGDDASTFDRQTVAVVLDPDMEAELIVAHNGEFLFVGCLDRFGSLDCEKLLNRLNKSLKSGFVKAVSGGAEGGIGILRMIDLSTDFFAVVESGTRTLVGCCLPLGTRPKNIQTAPKSFFMQRFHTYQSDRGAVRVEKRNSSFLLRLYGNIDAQIPFSDLFMNDAREVVVDMRFTKSIDRAGMDLLLRAAGNSHELQKVYFDHVPVSLIDVISKMAGEKSGLIELRSGYVALTCSSCAKSQERQVDQADFQKEWSGAWQCDQCRNHQAPPQSKT